MKSYTGLRNLYGKFTLDTSSSNLTWGDELINDDHKHLCSLRDFTFLHRARTMLTTASTQFKALPYDIEQVESVFVTVSDQRRVPKMLHSREQWDILNRSVFTSDFPEYAFVYNGELGLWPTPATSSNVITVNGKIRATDLNTADITSTTITTLANASAAITVSGGLTAQMVGFWIRPTFSTTANTGDGNWYEIGAVASATAGTLVRTYGGNSIAAGTAASTIAQMPLLPEPFHDLPAVKAAQTYWEVKGNAAKASSFGQRYLEGVESLIEQYSEAVTDPVLDSGEDRELINPNLTIFMP